VPGMSLAKALMRCPQADFFPADHAAYRTVQQGLLAAVYQYTDRVETAGLGLIYIEVGQLARRFPEDDLLAQAIIEAVRETTGLDVRAGLAEQRFTAEQAARTAPLNHAIVVPSRQGRSFLSSLPLDVLPAEDEFLRRLDLLGIHTLGKLAAFPRVALIRQFGAKAGFLHDLAAGADPRPVAIDAPPLELRHEITFEPPTVVRQTLFAAAERLTNAIAETLNARGYQAQGLRIEIVDTSSIPHTTTTSVEPPTAEIEGLTRRVQVMVSRIRLGHPAETLEIVVYPLRPAYLGASQLALFSADRDERWRALQEALRRLRQRFGDFIVMIASLLNPPKPYPIEVITDREGIPTAFNWEGRRYRIVGIYEHWRERRFWWSRPIYRDFYRLEDHNEQVRVIVHDLRTTAWWLDRRGM
jgi:nucleotidyltransferase/DNA polymerase involved in DNA repair